MDITKVNRKEINRYLGYRNISPDENVNRLIDEVLIDASKLIMPKYIAQRFKISIKDNIVKIDNSDIYFESKNLSDNLSGCDEMFMFAATLGAAADNYIHRLSITNMAKASVAQAAFASLIESFCNEKQKELGESLLKEGLYLKPRFSPGYGDLKLESQKSFFELMEITKRLGITLTESMLMFPTKSVSAFIGITNNNNSCHIAKCRECKNKDCEFRNEEDN